MSDSDDDNAYDDYLESRRAAIEKKRQPVNVYQSDSDDDVVDEKASPFPKRKRAEHRISLDDSDDESFLVPVESHEQAATKTMHDIEGEYLKHILSNNGIIHVSHTERNDALSNVMRVVESMDKKKTVEVEEIAEGLADTSTGGSFPVSVVIMDYESSLKSNEVRNRREVALESTFVEIRKELAERWKCRLDDVILSCNGVTIEANTTPSDLGLRPLQVPQPIDASRRGGASKEEGAEEVITVENEEYCMILKVQVKNRRKPVHVKATDETKIQDIKQMVINTLIEEDDKKVPSSEKMKVMFDDEYLTEMDATCKDVGLEDGDCIDIYY